MVFLIWKTKCLLGGLCPCWVVGCLLANPLGELQLLSVLTAVC